MNSGTRRKVNKVKEIHDLKETKTNTKLGIHEHFGMNSIPGGY